MLFSQYFSICLAIWDSISMIMPMTPCYNWVVAVLSLLVYLKNTSPVQGHVAASRACICAALIFSLTWKCHFCCMIGHGSLLAPRIVQYEQSDVCAIHIEKAVQPTPSKIHLLHAWQCHCHHTTPIKLRQSNTMVVLRSWTLTVRLAKIIFVNLFHYSVYFCYYSWVSLYFLVVFMNLIVLFQLTFTFIYSTFNKKFSVLVK